MTAFNSLVLLCQAGPLPVDDNEPLLDGGDAEAVMTAISTATTAARRFSRRYYRAMLCRLLPLVAGSHPKSHTLPIVANFRLSRASDEVRRSFRQLEELGLRYVGLLLDDGLLREQKLARTLAMTSASLHAGSEEAYVGSGDEEDADDEEKGYPFDDRDDDDQTYPCE